MIRILAGPQSFRFGSFHLRLAIGCECEWVDKQINEPNKVDHLRSFFCFILELLFVFVALFLPWKGYK